MIASRLDLRCGLGTVVQGMAGIGTVGSNATHGANLFNQWGPLGTSGL
jgi:hypothetical protein